MTTPPPLVQDNLPHAAPRPYDPPSHHSAPYQGDPYAAPPYQTGAPYPGHAATPPAQQAAPPYPAQYTDADVYPGMDTQNPAYAPRQFDQNGPYDPNYAGQPAYAYPQATVPSAVIEPAGARASLLSRLTGRGKLPPSHAPYPDPQPETGPVTASARKPFLMGLLTGVVIMLILGQIFRAAQPSPDYAQAQFPLTKTVTSDPVAGEPEVLAFLETVEGLN
ncbi:hypothetical protein GCM10009069_06060 [Algimonas arctica]|uniref:Uncharacterized protein n=1 Tax=Algimonas arctica TaxID=1479486 RepID=A0A8J3CQE1_9PROT|nr:hypothetical protein GCM10009069_06060 [Algimonas arctica]